MARRIALVAVFVPILCVTACAQEPAAKAFLAKVAAVQAMGKERVIDLAPLESDAAKKGPKSLRLDAPDETHYRITGEVLLPPGASLTVLAGFPGGDASKPVLRGSVTARKDGDTLAIGKRKVRVADAGETWVPFVMSRINNGVRATVCGEPILAGTLAADAQGCALVLAKEAKARDFRAVAFAAFDPLAAPVELEDIVNVPAADGKNDLGGGLALDAASLPGGVVSVDGTPFVFGKGLVDVSASMKGAREPLRVKGFLMPGAPGTQPERLLTNVAADRYSALHLVAFSRKLEGGVPRLTVRLGSIGGGHGVIEDARVGVPDISPPLKGAGSSGSGQVISRVPVKLASGEAGALYHLRVPLPQTGSLWEFADAAKSGAMLTLELTRDVNVYVTAPDSWEFGLLPAGSPSSVVVAAATLERSPVAASCRTEEAGNIFSEGQKAVFTLSLENRSGKAAAGRAYARCEGPGLAEEACAGREPWTVVADYALAPGEKKEVALDVTPPSRLRGWYSCAIGVEAGGETLQERRTSFAILAPDTRKAKGDSPFGVWCFFGSHTLQLESNVDMVARLGSIMKKGGWRWTYGGSPLSYDQTYNIAKKSEAEIAAERRRMYLEVQQKYGFICTLNSPPESYQRDRGWYDEAGFQKEVVPWLAEQRDRGVDNYYKVLHESRSSSTLLLRIGELLGGKPYEMPDEERQRVEAQVENVRKYCLAIKAADPQARIVLINDYPGVALEYLKRKFPPEAFDVIGLEGAMFSRQPERPFDWLCLLCNMANIRRGMKLYGYDKPMWTTEALYHGTNPGNLTLHQQGVISVREAMLALANGIQRMAAAGLVADSSDDYYWSNWGAGGYCFRDPERNPKPSYAMYAWLTQVLDGAKFAGRLETGSTSLHVLDFARADGAHVYPVWVPRGRQTVTLAVAGGAPVVFDVYGNVATTHVADGKIAVEVSDTPIYVTGTQVTGVAERKPVEMAAPAAQALVEFDNPQQLAQVKERSAVLEGNWQTPRFRGEFKTDFVTEDGASALRVELLQDKDERKLLPRYVELALAQPLALAQRPYALAARVKGNGGWGQVVFELVDARGRIWTSCGNQFRSAANSNDCRGDSYVSFDGWQTIVMPLPGQYPGGDQFVHWPRNFDWWASSVPEAAQRKADYEKALKEYEAARPEYEKAKAAHEAAMKEWEEAKKQAEAEKKKAPPAPQAPKPLNPPREPQDMGTEPVDYPLKLTKVIVTMAPHILYVNDEAPVKAPVIFLDRIGVLEPPEGM